MKTLIKVIQRLGLIGTLIVGLVWIIGRPLGAFSGLDSTPQGFVRLEFLLGLILALLSTLALYEVVRFFERPEEQALVRETAEAAKRIEKAQRTKNIDIIKAPGSKDEYAALWAGFTGY